MIACLLRRKMAVFVAGVRSVRGKSPGILLISACSPSHVLMFIRMKPPTISATPTHLSHANDIFSAPSDPNTSISAATVNCESKIAEIATVGVRLPIAHITVSVMTGASTPPSHAYHGACGNSRMLPLPKKTAMSSASKKPTSCTNAFVSSVPTFSPSRVFITPCTLIAAPARIAERKPSIKRHLLLIRIVWLIAGLLCTFYSSR